MTGFHPEMLLVCRLLEEVEETAERILQNPAEQTEAEEKLQLTLDQFQSVSELFGRATSSSSIAAVWN